jgi:hypothetical protein
MLADFILLCTWDAKISRAGRWRETSTPQRQLPLILPLDCKRTTTTNYGQLYALRVARLRLYFSALPS